MATQVSTLDKLEIQESFYRQGFQSDVVDRALDKILALERAHTCQELTALQARLEAFEREYQMSSEDFYRCFHDGKLGDEADFFEWSAFYDMAQTLRKRLQNLEIEVA